MRAFILPVFIPHAGCPHRCVFCNQEATTEEARPVRPHELRAYVTSYLNELEEAKSQPAGERSLNPRRRPSGSRGIGAYRDEPSPLPELAFYGGTFTNLPLSHQEEYLASAADLKREGIVSGTRLSTRPDALRGEHVELLLRYEVRTVELGAQSLDDEVLALTERGHTAADTLRAAGLIQEAGMRLGIQLMPGLPGATVKREIDTARRAVEMRPAFVRIYPTVVLQGTRLAEWFRQGKYRPLTLERAVDWCARMLGIFEEASIPVIRIGLQATPLLDGPETILAGPYHPALGSLVRSRLQLERICSLLGPARGASSELTLVIPPREESIFRGQRNANIAALQERYDVHKVNLVPDATLAPASFVLMDGSKTLRWGGFQQREECPDR